MFMNNFSIHYALYILYIIIYFYNIPNLKNNLKYTTFHRYTLNN